MPIHTISVLLFLVFFNARLIAPFVVKHPTIPLSSFLPPSGCKTTTRQRSSLCSNRPTNAKYDAILDFTKQETIDKIDRLDDAVMGGISTSSVQPVNGYAMWAGVCRTDGGYVTEETSIAHQLTNTHSGFCGFRTNPFESALMVPGQNVTGLYVDMKLVSDTEPERRVWKVTTRTRPDRGEQLYQAPIVWNSSTCGEFEKYKVPFEAFQLVKGARRITDGPPLNYTSGLFQLGMTLSKFAIDGELKDFRDGVFQVLIREIGFYTEIEGEVGAQPGSIKLDILSKAEAKKKRPMALKVLGPVAKVVFFSEESQRRKSALRQLQKRWKLSRLGAWRWSLQRRRRAEGLVKAIIGWGSIMAGDSMRFLVGTSLRLTLLYPILALRKLLRGALSIFPNQQRKGKAEK